MHVGQAEIAALEAEREFGVVEAEEMQERGVQVVDVHPILDRVEAEFVGRAERDEQRGEVLGAGANFPAGAFCSREIPRRIGRLRWS